MSVLALLLLGLLVLGGTGVVIAVSRALSNGKGGALVVCGVIAAGLFCLLGVGLLMWLSVSHTVTTARRGPVIVHTESTRTRPVEIAEFRETADARAITALEEPNADQPLATAPSESKSADDASEVAIVATPTAVRVISEEPAEWITQGTIDEGDRELHVVTSGFYAEPLEAEQDALRKARKLLKTDFQKARTQNSVDRFWGDALHNWGLTDAAIADLAVRRHALARSTHDFGSVQGNMYRVHLQVEVSPAVNAQLEPIWSAQVGSLRLANLGIVVALLTLFAGVWNAYLRITAATEGKHRHKLKFVAALVMYLGLPASALFYVNWRDMVIVRETPSPHSFVMQETHDSTTTTDSAASLPGESAAKAIIVE